MKGWNAMFSKSWEPDRKLPQNKTYVIGQQMADAIEKERRREAENLGPSPLPKYRYNGHEFWLLEPQQTQLDKDLIVLCNQFPQLNSTQRKDFRHRISLNEFYTLLTFAKRSAVFAIRNKDINILRAGLRAIAMIEIDRIDFRDIGTPMGPLYYAALKIGLDPAVEITNAAELSEPKVRDYFFSLLKRCQNKEFNLASESLLIQVETPSGPGFVERDLNSYQPDIDLLNIALDIVKLIETDKYQSDSPVVGTKIPEVWFGDKISAVKNDLDTLLGTVNIRAHLDDQYSEKARDQCLWVWLAETPKVIMAAHLSETARLIKPKSYCLLAVSQGNLFCFVVARSVIMNLEPFEKEDSLCRFELGIERALKKGLNKPN